MFAAMNGYLKMGWPWRTWDDDRQYGPDGKIIRGGLSRRDGQDKLMIEARLVWRFWGGIMRDHAASWGAVGGIVTYQVEPYADNDPQEVGDPLGFRHELNLVAAVPAEARGRIMAAYGEPHHVTFEFVHRKTDSPGYQYRQAEPVRAELVPGDDPHALRRLLAGTGFNYRPYEDGSWDNAVGRHPWGGVDGALRPMPWMLANPDQWWDHQWSTRRLPTYRPFGSWCPRPAGAMTEAAREARTAPLLARNRARADAARDRRSRLLGAARLVPGAVALGWRPLREEMAKLGHEVSVRDAREISRALKDDCP